MALIKPCFLWDDTYCCKKYTCAAEIPEIDTLNPWPCFAIIWPPSPATARDDDHEQRMRWLIYSWVWWGVRSRTRSLFSTRYLQSAHTTHDSISILHHRHDLTSVNPVRFSPARRPCLKLWILSSSHNTTAGLQKRGSRYLVENRPCQPGRCTYEARYSKHGKPDVNWSSRSIYTKQC